MSNQCLNNDTKYPKFYSVVSLLPCSLAAAAHRFFLLVESGSVRLTEFFEILHVLLRLFFEH